MLYRFVGFVWLLRNNPVKFRLQRLAANDLGVDFWGKCAIDLKACCAGWYNRVGSSRPLTRGDPAVVARFPPPCGDFFSRVDSRMETCKDGLPDKKIRFDGTVNAGHLLSLVAFLVSGFIAWSALDKRVVVLEEARKAQIERDEAQDRYLRDRIDLLSKGQDQIQRSIERLADRFEGPIRKAL